MIKQNTLQTNFTSGELSPWLLGRSDIERYQNGAEVIENFNVRAQGGLVGRRGTKNVCRTGVQLAEYNVRIVPFEFSRSDAVMIEVSAGSFRFSRAGTPIYSTGVTPYEVLTIYGVSPAVAIPYTSAEIPELQFAQSADVLFITHPNHPQATLSRYGELDWRYEVPEFDYGPYLDQEIGDQDISLTLSSVTDRVALRSSATDFAGTVANNFIEYAYAGQKVLGRVTKQFDSYHVDVEPLEDRSLVLSKEVYSPGLYTGWDGTNNVPTYNTTITGTNVTVAFSAVGVVTQAHIGNYLRFTDTAGTYYWMLVDGVGDIPRQGAYGILATGDILTVTKPSGRLTRGDRRINARLQSSEASFFNLSTDAGRLFRLVIADTVVHARARSSTSYTVVGNTSSGNVQIDLDYASAERVMPGDTITGTGIQANTVVVSSDANDIQSFCTVSLAPTATATGVSLTVAASTATNLGVTLNRSLPRSVEGLTASQNGTTNDWNRGAWYVGNYPQTVSFHEGRLGFAGTALQPQTGWLSKTDDLYNFATTDEKLRVLDDCAINFTIASDTLNEILWMTSRDVLVIGTVGAEWKVAASTQGAPLTPSNISVKAQSSYGSAFTRPISIGQSLLYLQRAGRKLRQMTYDYQTDSQVSTDLTVFAEHILKDHSGGTSMAYQQLPESAVYVLLDDGQVACLTYEPDQKVFSWSRLVLGGPSAVVESIACVPEGNQYRLYLVVSRTINATNVRTIEVLEPEFRPGSTVDWSTRVFMDNYVYFATSHTAYVSGMNDYKGCTISALIDDTVYTGISVAADGTCTLPAAPTTRYAVGFPFSSVLKTFPIEAPGSSGTSQGKQKRIDHLTLRLLNTKNFSHGPSLSLLTTETPTATDLYSGDYRVTFANGYDTRAAYYIVQSNSQPIAILSLMPEVANFS